MEKIINAKTSTLLAIYRELLSSPRDRKSLATLANYQNLLIIKPKVRLIY